MFRLTTPLAAEIQSRRFIARCKCAAVRGRLDLLFFSRELGCLIKRLALWNVANPVIAPLEKAPGSGVVRRLFSVIGEHCVHARFFPASSEEIRRPERAVPSKSTRRSVRMAAKRYMRMARDISHRNVIYGTFLTPPWARSAHGHR